jgi:SAM-dependent methyltransferase
VLVSLGDDMVPAPEFLEQHLKWHGPGSRNVVLGGVSEHPRSEELFVARAIGWTRDYGARISFPGYAPTYHDLLSGNFSVRRQELLDSGGWRFGSGSGAGYDSDLGHRLREHGLTLRAEPAAKTCQLHSTRLGPALLQARAVGEAQVRYFEEQPGRLDDLIVSPFVLGPLWRRVTLRIARFTPGWLLVAYARAFVPLLGTSVWRFNRVTAALVRRLWAVYVCRGFWDRPDGFRALRRALAARNPTMEWFRSYWRDMTTPEHLLNTESFLSAHAQEVSSFAGDRAQGWVLEIGCGNGVLFQYFGFDPARYRGVDLSESMLGIFAGRGPSLDLVLADGSSYFTADRKYNLIFSTGVVQHFDASMLASHLENARKMLAPGGQLLLGAVPDRRYLWRYLGGLSHGARVWSPMAFARNVMQGQLGTRNGLGHWYTRQQLERLAAQHGFAAEITRSRAYPHCVHVLLTAVGDPAPATPQPPVAPASASL